MTIGKITVSTPTMGIELDNIMKHLTLHSSFLNDSGLYKGKLGIIIVCYQYAHTTGNKLYEDIADSLLEEALPYLPSSMSIGLADGICGIGWSICHLLENHFVEGDAVEILQEIDNRILEYNPSRMMDLSLETGLGGIAAYLTKRNQLLGDTSTYLKEYRKIIRTRIGNDFNKNIKHFINEKETVNVTLENNWYQLGLNNGCAGKAWLLMNK